MSASGRLVTTGLGATIVYLASFYYRVDYGAHLIVGCGLAGIVWVGSSRFVGSVDGRCALAVFAVLAVGIIGELTVFGPRFDWVDVANAAIGSVLVVAALGRFDPLQVDRGRIVVVGVVFVALGLLLRYQIQTVTSQWWWGA